MKPNTIPFIFAITGHRNLRSEDVLMLRKSIGELFGKYQKDYSNTELILLSALAEGADMLVADVAKELGLTLHVMLPYEERAYLESFANVSNEEKFYELKEYASKVETLSCTHQKGTTECYKQLGEYLADTSNILIALWDGVDNGKLGGTSAVVNYMRKGFEVNRFDALDGNALFIVTTPRLSNPHVKSDFSVKYECLGKHIKGAEFANMLKKIDRLNAETTIDKLDDGSVAKSYMKHFSRKARKNQGLYKLYSKLLLSLTFVAIACLEIMHTLLIEGIESAEHLIIGYGVGLLLAFGLYYFLMEKGKVQDNFVYSRGFAEALRIQNAWNHAGLKDSVAKYYLYNQHYKFVWLKVVLKNLYYLDKEPFHPYETKCSVMNWIDEEIAYFKEKSQERHKKLKIAEFVEHSFYGLGVVSLVLMFIIYALESKGEIAHGEWWFNWHYLVLASGLFLLVAAFVGEKYVKIEGYEEEIYHFNVMHENFSEAKKLLEGVDELSDKYKKIVYDLGRKALHENRMWVVLHDKMRAEPVLE